MMDKRKTKGQLLAEIEEMRGRIGMLQAAEIERKRVEEQLRERVEFINDALESLSHPFYVIDADDYTIKIANSAARARYNEKMEDVACYSLTHRLDKPCGEMGEKCPLDEVKRTKKAVTVEHVHYDRDDNERIYEVHGHPVLDELGNVVQMIEYSLDITERKRAEEEVKRLARYFENLVGSAGDAILSISHPDNVITSWNSRAESLFGYTKEEVLGRDAEEFFPGRIIPPEHQETRKVKIEEIVQEGKTVQFEGEGIRKDGTRFSSLITISPLMDTEGNIIGRTAIHKDITESKRTQQIVESLKMLYENVVQSIEEGLAAHDREFRITMWNKAMERITGYPAEEVLGKVAFDVFPHLDEQGAKGCFQAALRG